MTDGADQRAFAFSQQLRQIHHQLRGQLSGLRADLGRPEPANAGLSSHCLAFCAALTEHHEGEDASVFTALLAVRPDLADAVLKLREDHTAIAAILASVRDLAGRAATTAAKDLPALRRELDGLAAIAESHFRYEERAIGAALDPRG